jgi:hypothetical protein
MSSPAAPDMFEHGIEVAAGNGDPPAGLARLATREPNSIYSGYTLAIVDRDGSSLSQRAGLTSSRCRSRTARATFGTSTT